MDLSSVQTALRRQFVAAIDMVDRAVAACPETLWHDGSQRPQFWYVVYHTLFWLDLYLSGTVEGFRPPEPFGLEELDPAGVLPDRVYSKPELRTYLLHGRRKCIVVIDTLTEVRARERCRFGWGEASFLELLIDNLRHVQHAAGQLNLMLRWTTDAAPRWVSQVLGPEEIEEHEG